MLGPGPQPDPSRAYVANVLKVANAKLANCILAISGRTGVVDSHGDFDFYVTAYATDDGAFLDPARFRANINQTAEATADVMMRLIPSVEFKACRLR